MQLRRGRAAGFFILMLTLAAGLFGTAGAQSMDKHHAPAAARSWIDRRVDAIPDQALRTLPAAELVDPLRAQVAQRVASVKRPLFFFWALVQILAALWLWRSGNAAELRDGLRRRIPSRILFRAAYVAISAALILFAALPFDFMNYHTLADVGVTRQPMWSWFGDLLVAAGYEIALITVLTVFILESVDRSRLWYLWSMAFVVAGSAVVLVIDPLVIDPLFHAQTPLALLTPLGRELTAVENQAGLGNIPIYISKLSRTTEIGNAYVAGFGPTRRVLIGDTLLRTATPRETSFVMAHELGHERHHDPIRLMLVGDVLIFLAFAAAIIASDWIELRSDDDAISRLPLVGSLIGVCAMILLPFGNAYSRHVEAMADSFGLHVTHDGTAGARMFIRFADEGFSPVCPPRLVRLYFYDHPPLGSRIARLTGHPDPCP